MIGEGAKGFCSV